MLHRIHTGFCSPQDSLSAVRVRSHLPPQSMRVGDDGLYLFECVLRRAWIVTFREHATGSANLDQVRSILNDLADLVLHAFHAIRDAVSLMMEFIRKEVVIAVSTGDAEWRTAHQH